MSLANSLLSCLCGDTFAENHQARHPHHKYIPIIDEKPPIHPLPSATANTIEAINNDKKPDDPTPKIISVLLAAPSSATPTSLTHAITTATGLYTTDLTSYLAERVLHALEAVLKHGEEDHGQKESWGGAFRDAYAAAVEAAKQELAALWEYAREHPVEVAAEVLLTVLALGMLARMVPLLVRCLGFAELGPVEGEFEHSR